MHVPWSGSIFSYGEEIREIPIHLGSMNWTARCSPWTWVSTSHQLRRHVSHLCEKSVQRQWRCVPITGEAPQSRYGPGLCAVGNTLYLFGGQTDSTFWNDVWTIDVSSLDSQQSDSSGSKDALSWVQIHTPSTNIPAKRTNHTWIPYGRNIYLYVVQLPGSMSTL